MSTRPREQSSATPAPSYRREKWLLATGAGVLTLVVSAGGGLLIGSSLAQQANQSGRVGNTTQTTGSGAGHPLFAFGAGQPMGPTLAFDPNAFPHERFPGGETEVASESTEATVTERTVEEFEPPAPVDLLGAPTDGAPSDGDTEGGDIFFGQDAPTDDDAGAGETNLFDLGASEEPAPVATEPEHFTLSLGSFESRANADQLVKTLLGAGITATVSESTKPDGAVVFRVYGSRFDSREDGQAQVDTLRGMGIDAWLVKG